MSKHSPTPWVLETPAIVDAYGGVALRFFRPESRKDNGDLALIVSCVNACAGIDPESISSLYHACGSLADICDRILNSPGRAADERLAVAVEHMIAYARAALAAATGKDSDA